MAPYYVKGTFTVWTAEIYMSTLPQEVIDIFILYGVITVNAENVFCSISCFKLNN